MAVGVTDDSDESGTLFESLDFSDDDSAFEVGIG